MKRFFSRAPKKGKIPAINATLLGEHFASIKQDLEELISFKKKRIVHPPVHVYWKTVDIEDAWEESQEMLLKVHHNLNEILSFILPGSESHLNLETGFLAALHDTFKLLEKIIDKLADALGTGALPEQKLNKLNEIIFQTQENATALNKFVCQEFDYS